MLRDYQLECLLKIREALATHGSTLVELPTGTGKTELFLHLAHEWDGRVIIAAHRDELIRQPAHRYKRMFDSEVGIEKGQEQVQETGHFLDRHKIIVTSVQTMCRPNRMARFHPEDFSLLVIDEAHHAPARSYRAMIDHFQKNRNLKLLGVTATPKRKDELAMGQVFASVAYRMTIESAIEKGWLVPIRQFRVKVEGLSFDGIRKVKGDLDQAELDRILRDEEMLHKMAKPIVDNAADRPGLVFCVNVNHAQLLAAMLNRYKPSSAAFISGDKKQFPGPVRRKMIEDFRASKIQFLCSCNLLFEGFDAPNAVDAWMCRPTLSLTIYTQSLGRITRRWKVPEGIETPEERRQLVAESPKPFGNVWDFVGNSTRHKLITAVDILGGRYGMPIRQRAKQIAEQEEDSSGKPVDDLLEQAEVDEALEAEQSEWERRRWIKADRVEARLQQVSPFSGGTSYASGGAATLAPPASAEMASDKQAGYIAYLSHGRITKAQALKMTKKQASGVIGKLRGESGE